jgi:hypothetical protein
MRSFNKMEAGLTRYPPVRLYLRRVHPLTGPLLRVRLGKKMALGNIGAEEERSGDFARPRV